MIRTETHGTVRILMIDNPPVNARGVATRRAIAKALHDVVAEDTIDSVILCGTGNTSAPRAAAVYLRPR